MLIFLVLEPRPQELLGASRNWQRLSVAEGFDKIQAQTTEELDDAGSVKKGAKSSCQTPLIIPCSLFSLKLFPGWVRSPAGDFCGQTSQLHAEHETERDSP